MDAAYIEMQINCTFVILLIRAYLALPYDSAVRILNWAHNDLDFYGERICVLWNTTEPKMQIGFLFHTDSLGE